jgi:hypothetical protein
MRRRVSTARRQCICSSFRRIAWGNNVSPRAKLARSLRCVPLDVHFGSPTSVPSWERRAPARLWKPRGSVALPGETLGNWQYIDETDS